MRWLALMSAAAFVAACAPFADRISTIEAGCDQGSFTEMAACLKAETADIGGRDDDLFRLYAGYAAVLSERVEAGNMSELEAELSLAEKYMMLKSESAMRTSRALVGLGQGLQQAGAAMQQAAPPPPVAAPIPTLVPSTTTYLPAPRARPERP